MEIGKAKQRAAANCLAGFFALMVLLTFLSRAADSFTVPKVTAEKLSEGSLTHKVTSEGALFPVSRTAVFAPSGYRLLALHVENGGRVAVGDVLAELDTAQMKEQLEASRAELQKLRLIAAANAVQVSGETEENGVPAAERALLRARADLEIAEAETGLHLESAEQDVVAARKHLRELRDLDDAPDTELDDARETVRRQELALEAAVLAREKALELARRAIEDAELLIEKEKRNADNVTGEEAAETRREALNREAAEVDITLAERKVSELEALLETEGLVTAETGGVVMKVSGEVGSLTSAESLLVLSDGSAGVLFRGSVKEEDLKHLRRGSRATLQLTGESRAVDAVIESVAPSADEDGRYGITVLLPDGDWEPGTSGKLTVTEKTAPYPLCVSNGAVRKDQNGHFVLVAREAKGVLGVQTIAERVPVGVLERDGNRCAIEGPLTREDLIIGVGDRPVSAGDRIRIDKQ